MARRKPDEEAYNLPQVTAAELTSVPAPPAPPPRLSYKEAAANLAVRCPDCHGIGELKYNLVTKQYAAVCRRDGRYTRWYATAYEVLTAPAPGRQKLKALKE